MDKQKLLKPSKKAVVFLLVCLTFVALYLVCMALYIRFFASAHIYLYIEEIILSSAVALAISFCAALVFDIALRRDT